MWKCYDSMNMIVVRFETPVVAQVVLMLSEIWAKFYKPNSKISLLFPINIFFLSVQTTFPPVHYVFFSLSHIFCRTAHFLHGNILHLFGCNYAIDWSRRCYNLFFSSHPHLFLSSPIARWSLISNDWYFCRTHQISQVAHIFKISK